MARVFRGETKIDFIGRRRMWFALSGLLILVSAVTLVVKGLNYGIEFEGGVSIKAPVAADGPLAGAAQSEIVSAVEDALAPFEVGDAQIQISEEGETTSVLVQTKEIADAEEQGEVVAAVSDSVGASIAETDSQRIGSKWGQEITDKAVRALIIFFVVVLAFMSWRFEWKMGLAALVALVHDLVITAGVYSLVGFEVTPSSVIAILTILGYSLYDTVVVFDKVEEDAVQLAATGRMTYQDSANLALNEVFMRSLNTTLSTLLPVAALLFVGAGLLGASTLRDLALALFVGLLASAYSSIFVATPVLSMWKEREPRYTGVRERLLRDAKRTAVPAAGRDADTEVRAEPELAAVGSRPSTAARPPARPRAGSKKAKRRKRR
ncbi:MAG TPA: protein translocase subunit SecF [Actinomycetota bacterium]|nr:protein translocase subunit SecF [Actinomycetota bacterium]